jgi:hypothetical protein
MARRAGGQIGNGNTNLDWRTIPSAGDVHQPHLGFHHDGM